MPCAADRVPCARSDGELVPHWLTAADQPWLRELLLDAGSFVGKPLASLQARWRASDAPPRAGPRWPFVLQVLRRHLVPRAAAATALRARVFAAAAAGRARADVLAAAAAEFGIEQSAVPAALFADLGAARVVRWPAGFDATRLRLDTNAAFARLLLATATAAELELHGASRAVLRTAWLHGAHFRCLAASPAGARLAWRPAPGDRRSGWRLASLVPVLPWTRRYVLRASCRWRRAVGTFVLSSLDELMPGAAPTPFDSRLERDLAAALVRALPEWDVAREPAPLPRGDRLAFPDFALQRRGDARDAWWIEVAGLREPAALAGKLELLRAEGRYLLCLPRRWCVGELAAEPRVCGFHGPRCVARLAQWVRTRIAGAGDAAAE
jgi:hypothetical protein